MAAIRGINGILKADHTGRGQCRLPALLIRMHYNALYRDILACSFWNIGSRQRVVVRYTPLSVKHIDHQALQGLYRTFHDLLMEMSGITTTLVASSPKLHQVSKFSGPSRTWNYWVSWSIVHVWSAITKDICNLWEDPSPVPPSQLSR